MKKLGGYFVFKKTRFVVKTKGECLAVSGFLCTLHSTNRRFVHYNVTTQRRVNMNEVNFDILVNRIEETQHVLQNNARLVINRHVTAKAWLVGCYIVEYEQKGEDRAKYGERLIDELANAFVGIKH